MKNIKIIFAVTAALFALCSCKSQYEILLESNDVDAKYQMAMDLFNKGKYTRSAQMFENISVLTSGTDRDDTVQFYWALSNYNGGDYYTAETNFDQFITKYPRSGFAPNAEFLRVDCLYRQTLRWELDQTPSFTAMTEISEYLRDHPTGAEADICRNMLEDLMERQDRKAYENAKIYYRMEDYKASRVAFKNILKDDAENIYREDILYYAAMSSYKYADLSVQEKQKERFLIFVDDYLNFIGEYSESKYRKELDGLYEKVKDLI